MLILLSAYLLYLIRDLVSNGRPLRENKEQWLLTTSKVLIIFGVLCYQTGNSLPGYLQEFSNELNCNERCVQRGLIAGVGLLLVALTTFVFIPDVFRKINKVINEDFNEHFIREEEFRDYRMQWFVLRMLAITLDFDAVYSGIWIYRFVDFENCDLDDIVGSSLCILTGWFVWSLYAATFSHYLNNLSSIVRHFKAYTLLHARYRIVNVLYYVSLVLFLALFFPAHIVANNAEPLSCGCSTTGNTTVFACKERPGVLEARLVLLFYQVVVVTALGTLGAIKYSLQETEYGRL